MTDIGKYLEELTAECRKAFADRLLYIGLQGSYLRGEASERSDIDIMHILDRLTPEDMDEYRLILKRIGQSERSCGFICGRDEMLRWNPLEICQLRHTTGDVFGRLEEYLPEASRGDELNYVKLSLGNLYHELCHRYIHADRARNVSRFRGTCKNLFFLIQNLHFLESGVFAKTKGELKKRVSPEDREMLGMAELPDDYDFDTAFCAVFEWCQRAFIRIGKLN